MLHLIFFDPGGTIGYSAMRVPPEAILGEQKVLSSIQDWAHGQYHTCVGNNHDPALEISAMRKVYNFVLGRYSEFPSDEFAFGIEDFLLRKNSKDREVLSPVRQKAVLEYIIWQDYPDAAIIVQQPSMAKTTVTDDRLKRWGYYEAEGGLNHARDADRHIITAFRRATQKKELRQKWWPKTFTK